MVFPTFRAPPRGGKVNAMHPKVDHYLSEGCGRCPLGGTPACKVHAWTGELLRLRATLLDCGLEEESKWSVPCYTFRGKNILILAAFKDYCAVSFFKGALLQDAQGILSAPGENTQSARFIRYTSAQEVEALQQTLRAYIFEAIEVENAGLKPEFKAKSELVYPDELLERFAADPELEAAFERLTPGRKRGYILQFTQPKQSATRSARIEKFRQKILEGKSWEDR